MSDNNNNNRSLPPATTVRLKYEVFGKVQGVFFRKYTLRTAERLGVRGYVRNTSHGTVVGEVEGPRFAVDEFKTWVAHKGSPKSTIDQCEFSSECEVGVSKYDNFTIIKKKR